MQVLVVDAIQEAVASVFGVMLGVTPRLLEAKQISHPIDEREGVQALIGLAGAWIGTGAVACSPDLACRLASGMMMTEFLRPNEEVLDAVAEIGNMVIGNLKCALETTLGPMGLSTPTVIYGRSFTTKIAGHVEWTLLRFEVYDEEFDVQAAFHPNQLSHPEDFTFVGHLFAKS
jgi:chemotaxis protein CheX